MFDHPLSRRSLLRRTAVGFGSLALASLFAEESLRANAAETNSNSANPLAPKLPHFPARAKR